MDVGGLDDGVARNLCATSQRLRDPLLGLEVVRRRLRALIEDPTPFMGPRLLPSFPTLVAAFCAAALACAKASQPETTTQRQTRSGWATSLDGATAPSSAALTPDAGAAEGPWLGAITLQAPIWSEMEWPNERRSESSAKPILLGYLRYGEKAPVVPEPHRKSNCLEGWYELLAGGFVCGRFATLDLNHPRFRTAAAPDLDGPLPYTYGANVANGTPLYRQLPSREQRKLLEPWLFKPRKPKPDEDDDPYGALTAADAVDPPDDADADIPWWEKEVPDGGPPQVTLEDLQETDGPISRRMVKGFFLSLDHEFDAGGAKWWRTVSGLSAPYDRIVVAKPLTDFHGVWLGHDDGDSGGTFATKNVASRKIDKLPVAFVLTFHAKRWTLDADRKHVTPADGPLDRFDAFGLTGQTAKASGIEFWETDEGWWLRAIDATKTEPGPIPEGVGATEKWIDVNLRRQTLVAFAGPNPAFVTLFSSGRNEHETSPGSFRIKAKHISATMARDPDVETATEGPYSMEDVPYIEYFNAGYALHGAFWHSAFGFIKSHGCVNLSPLDAKAIFAWTDPILPQGWHAVFANKDNPGTRVIVHERAPHTCMGPSIKPSVCP
jgi:L,D-transpeptidase-like protein